MSDDLKAYVFDAYGTLFDVHSAVRRHAAALGPEAERVSELWRTKQLEYSWVRALMGRYRDFWSLTEDALDYALMTVPSANANARDDLLNAYRTLDCYAEVPDMLRALRERGVKTAILSNGSPGMLTSAVESASIGTLLDDTFSVDGLATFKVDPAVYQLVTDAYGLEPHEVAFQSSNRWDIAGASAFGFRCTWVNRSGAPDEYPHLRPERVVRDLSELIDG